MSVERLKRGNQRFIKNGDIAILDRLVKGQKPHTVVVSCSDSRVSPEIIFDQTLGDLFVIRSAGNTVDDNAIASIQYAVDHLRVPLVIVLGHEGCGAVNAAISKDENHPDELKNLLNEIRGHLKGCKAGEEVRANVESVVQKIKERLPGRLLEVVGAIYSLKTRLVTF